MPDLKNVPLAINYVKTAEAGRFLMSSMDSILRPCALTVCLRVSLQLVSIFYKRPSGPPCTILLCLRMRKKPGWRLIQLMALLQQRS